MMVGVFATLVLIAFLRWPKKLLHSAPAFFVIQDALVAFVGGRDSFIGGALQNTDEAGLAAILAATLLLLVAEKRRLRWHSWMTWFAVYLAAGAVSSVAGGAWVQYGVGVYLASKGFVFAFVIAQFDWTPEEGARWLWVLLGIIALNALFAFPDLIAPEAFRSFIGFDPAVDYRAGLPSVGSLFGHPGGFGWLMAVGALIALAALATDGDRRWRTVLVVALFFSALSLRRKPMLGVFVTAIVVLPTLGRAVDSRKLRALATPLLLVAIPLSVILGPIIAEGARAYLSSEALTTQARTALYGGAYLLARQHFPFGSGVGTYGSYGSVVNYSPIYYQFGFDSVYGMSPSYPNFILDTFWPQIVGETGLIGVIGYAGAIIAILLSAWKRARSGRDRLTQWTSLAAVLIGLEVILESTAAPTYSSTPEACVSLGLLSVAVAIRGNAQAPTPPAAES